MVAFERNLNALIIFILAGILLSAFGVEMIHGDRPCILCLLQRSGMVGVATALLLNLRFGIRMSHYALALFSSIVGASVALRQIVLHICPGFSAYGTPVLGLNLYTWSFLVFSCIVFGIAILLSLYNPKTSGQKPQRMNLWCRGAGVFIFVVTVANIFNTLTLCGLGFCGE